LARGFIQWQVGFDISMRKLVEDVLLMMACGIGRKPFGRHRRADTRSLIDLFVEFWHTSAFLTRTHASSDENTDNTRQKRENQQREMLFFSSPLRLARIFLLSFSAETRALRKRLSADSAKFDKDIVGKQGQIQSQ
jgi:hypothetical protein